MAGHMGKRDEAKSRAELTHALDALEDGAGQKTWGPGPVLQRLRDRDHDAYEAFHQASSVVYNVVQRYKREAVIAGLRRLAPVLLEMRLEDLATERAEFEARQEALKKVPPDARGLVLPGMAQARAQATLAKWRAEAATPPMLTRAAYADAREERDHGVGPSSITIPSAQLQCISCAMGLGCITHARITPAK